MYKKPGRKQFSLFVVVIVITCHFISLRKLLKKENTFSTRQSLFSALGSVNFLPKKENKVSHSFEQPSKLVEFHVLIANTFCSACEKAEILYEDDKE